MDLLAVPGDDISLASLSPDLSDDSAVPSRDEEDITVSDIETIDSAADFKLEVCYFIFTHLKKVIGWTSPFLRITEIIVVISVYVSIVTATFLVAFHRTYMPVVAFFYASDAVFVLHLLFIGFVALSPTTAWSTPNQLSFRETCRLHCLIDIITVIPLEIILGHLMPTKNYRITENISLSYVTLGRLNRLLRVYRIVRFFNNKKNDVILGTRYSDILSATCALTLLIHISACIWYLLGCRPFVTEYDDLNVCWCIKQHMFIPPSNESQLHETFEYHPSDWDEAHSWTLDIFTVSGSEQHHFFYLYIISAYWATVTALSVGYGDYRGLNFHEINFSVLVMLLGAAITNGLVVGSLTSLLTNVESQRATFAHRLMIIKRYLNDNKYSSDVSETIQGFYEYMWFKKRGQSKDNIYEALPPSLQSEICLSVNHCALSRSPMFKDLDEGFLRSIALKIQNHFYLPGQIVINKGTVSRSMYYVVRGELEVLSDRDNHTPVAVLRPGKLFGEVNLVLNFARTATIRAASHCDLLILNQHDVTPVLLHYPDARVAMWEYVQALFEMDFNDPGSPSMRTMSSEQLGLSMSKSRAEIVTSSARFMPTLSPMVESEESIGAEIEGLSAPGVKANEDTDDSMQMQGDKSKLSTPALLSTESQDKTSALRKSSIPVFKETKSLINARASLPSSQSNSPTQEQVNPSTSRNLSRPSMHIAVSSRRVTASELNMDKGDEPIPAFEKPDEVHQTSSKSAQRNKRFDWDETQRAGLRKQVRRPTIVARPRGMSEVLLGSDCAVLKTDTGSGGMSWLKQAMKLIGKPCINEDSTFDNTWKTCVWLVVMLQWFFYLYHANFHDGYGPATLMLTYFMDAVHVLDLLFSMMTVVITPRETYETYRQIFFYRSGTVVFYLDIIAAIPLDLFCLPFTVSMRASRRSQLITIFKLNKLTKAWVIYHRFRYFEDQLYVPLQLLRPLETVIYILMGAHLNACLWYMDANFGSIIASNMTRRDRWLKDFLEIKAEEKSMDPETMNPNNSAYLLSLYWASATMSTTGYGDIVAMSAPEYCISILTMVLGLILFSYTLASYASLLTNIDRPKVQFQSIVFAMENFMVENRLDKLLRKRVLRYMDVQWNAYDGLIMPGNPSLLHDLPEALKQDLAEDGIVRLLDGVPLFRGTDTIFRQELSSRCSRYLFPPNELVLYSGDLGRDMYIIIRGYCESYIGKRQKSLGLMGPGEYFGEAGMLFGLPRPAHVVTRTHCCLLAIPHGEFQRIMKKFPTVNMEIREIQDNAAILRTVKLNHARVWRLSKELPPSDDSLFPPVEPPPFTTFPEKDSSEEEYRRPFSELGGLGAVLARLLMPRTVRPDGRAAVRLECFRIVTIMLVLFVTPVHVTFAWKSVGVYALGILLDIVAMVFVYLRLHWAYYDETSTLVTHPIATAHNYLVSAFLLDLAGCFPLDLIAMLFYQGNMEENLHFIALFRSNRMIQAYEVAWAFYHWERRLVFRSGLFKSIKYLWYFVTYVHIIACMWAYIACPAWLSGQQANAKGIEGRLREYHEYNKTQFMEKHMNCRTYSWYSTSHFATKTNASLDLYIISIMYTLEMVASVGYGDMTPRSRIEFILSILLMLHGVMFFGFVIASVTASFVNADMTRANFCERVKELAEQMRYELVPEDLQKKVLKHVEYEFFRSQGMEAHALFTNLPPSIRGDVAIVLFEELISSVPIFKTIDRSFHRMLAMCLKEAFFLEGETVIYVGDMGEEMFFIHRGTCDIVDADGNTVMSLGPGRFFGEISVMFSIPRTVTIKARTNADLFILTKNDLQDVLENYPDIKREIERIAVERLQDAGHRSGSKHEQRTSSHKRDSSVRSGSLTGAGLMEARHGRKHKTHRRRSLVDQLHDALVPHALAKDKHEDHAVKPSLEDEYNELLHSEEHGERRRDSRRRSSHTVQIKQFMSRMFSSHSTTHAKDENTGLSDHAEVRDSHKATGTAVLESEPKEEDNPEVRIIPEVEVEQPEENASKEDQTQKVEIPSEESSSTPGSKPSVENTLPESESQNVQDISEVNDDAGVEKAPSQHAPLRVGNQLEQDKNQTEVGEGTASDEHETSGRDTSTASIASVKSSNNVIAPVSSKKDVEGTDGPTKLPRIAPKHLAQDRSARSSEEDIAKKVSSLQQAPIKKSSIKVSPSENTDLIVKQTSAAEGNAGLPSLQLEKPDVSHSMENTGVSVDKKPAAKIVKSVSHQLNDDVALPEINVGNIPAHESSAHMRERPSGTKASLQDLARQSSALHSSKVSISSGLSIRSQFRPPVWLDTCFRRVTQRIRRTISQRSDFIIDPDSSLLLLFNLLLAILGVTSIMILFYQLAFSDFNDTLNWCLLGISLVYTINIYIRMHTAFYDSYGDLVVDQNTVKKKYIRQPTGLLIDVLSALPIGILIFIHPGSPELSIAIHKVRFGQLARFYTVFSFFRSWEGVLKAPVLLLRGLRDVGFLLMLLHIWACFWYMAACPEAQCVENSWISARNLENSSNHEKYMNAVYFITATMTSTGYGEIHPSTMHEVVVCILAIIIGKFAIGLIIGDLASTLSNLEVARVDMETMLAVIVNQMKDQTVPKHLQKRVRQHVEYDWLRNRGHSLKDLLQHVPYCLRLEVFESIYGNQLRSISIFESAPDYVIRRISALCEQQVFLPGDFITKRGDIGRRVYIIRRGSVLVYRTSPEQPEYFLYSGSIYGDVQMVYPTIPYEHHLVADYPSDVLVINQEDIQLLLADNPHFFFRVRRYIQKKYEDIVHDKRPSMAVKASIY